MRKEYDFSKMKGKKFIKKFRFTKSEEKMLLCLKSLHNNLWYILRESDKELVGEFHSFCRKYISWR